MTRHNERANCHQAPGIDDFEMLKPISKGAFGHVYLVKRRGTEKLYAMKAMKKSDVLNKNMIEQVVAERDALALSKSPFIVQLFYSFQTKNNIFLVMEYLIGGDCKSLLHNLGYFDEDMARIYIAEITLALEYLHGHGMVHRDIKPDNMLISNQGHLKLTDFGLTRLTRDRTLNFHDLLETPSTDKSSSPSQRSKFWRTPGQIVSLTSKFTFSMPSSKKKVTATRRLRTISSGMPRSNRKSSFEFSSPISHVSRCSMTGIPNRSRLSSLTTPKNRYSLKPMENSMTDTGFDSTKKHIDFLAQAESSDESDVSTQTIPIVRCTGLTTELDNLLIKTDFSTSQEKYQEVRPRRSDGESGSDKENNHEDNLGPKMKRARLASPLKFDLNNSSDDEITFNPKTVKNVRIDNSRTDISMNAECTLNKDGMLFPLENNDLKKSNCTVDTENVSKADRCSPNNFIQHNKGSPSTALLSADNAMLLSPNLSTGANNSINSPTDLSSGYGTCNISGVTTLTDTTHMSVEDRSMHQNEESDSEQHYYSDEANRQLKFRDIALLSPVGQVVRKPSPASMVAPTIELTPPFLNINDSGASMSPMEIQEHRTVSSSSPLGESNDINGNIQKTQLQDELVSNRSDMLRHMSTASAGCGNFISDNFWQGHVRPMFTPAQKRHRSSSLMDMSCNIEFSSFRTPAPPIDKKRTPYRTPKSCRRGEVKPQACIIGTPDYLAPEILLNQEHGPSVDWWSLGVCLYEFLTGIPPFNDETPERVFQHILNRDLVWPEGAESLSEDAVDVINKILTSKARERPGAKEIKQHSFFANVNWKSLHKEAAPFVPSPDDAFDTTYFEARNNAQNLKISEFRK